MGTLSTNICSQHHRSVHTLGRCSTLTADTETSELQAKKFAGSPFHCVTVAGGASLLSAVHLELDAVQVACSVHAADLEL